MKNSGFMQKMYYFNKPKEMCRTQDEIKKRWIDKIKRKR